MLRIGLADVSGGAFNPAAGVLVDLWKNAERTQTLPDPARLAAEVSEIAEPRYATTGTLITRTGDCSAINLNAFAKGHIVDVAIRSIPVDTASTGSASLQSIIVNAGGDLSHRGAGAHLVGIENPSRPYDNEPPLCSISISNQAVATSGSARRGFTIGGQRFSHVISPTTGHPAVAVLQASVLADDAATADVVATILAVLDVEDGLRFVESLQQDIGCLLIDQAGGSHHNDVWADHLSV